MKINTDFILASQSPRRRKLLQQIGIPFMAIPADIDETPDGLSTPQQLAENLAFQKATTIATKKPDALILGADTLVVSEGEIFNKPKDEVEAQSMLQQLAGTSHIVYTGIALIHHSSHRSVTTVESTEVTFGKLSPTEILRYIKTGQPMDKAGAYGIQDDLGALFVERINGDYSTVVGLPLHRLYVLLKQHYGDLVIFE